MSLIPNTRLGPYEIVAPLGAGGMGEVYRARDTRLDRDVAIKVLPESVTHDADRIARFDREAKAVAALSHPNILAIYDVGSHEGLRYVVTELLEGETLRERLRRSAIPWRSAVGQGIAMTDGLAAAHAKGIIHRDLKPENIFLTQDGLVKILDFGLARVAPGPAVPAELQANTPTMTLDTRPGTVLGTVNYMSPEQISGRATDARTDIFSFGCVLYEMVSGRRAFGGDSVAETTTAILRDDPPTLSDSGKVVPAELDRLIARCHEKKPEQRIQSARDLCFALRDVLSDRRLSKPAVAHSGLRTRTMLGVQLAVGVVAVAAFLLTLNVAGWRERMFSRSQGRAISSLAVLPLENVSRDPEQEYFVDGMTEALISDLAKIGSLKVISRTSVMRYKATTKSLPEIAKELNVDAVVEGSVLRVGDRVRITAQLIHAGTDQHLWAESYDRELGDVLRLHSELARTVAQEIRVTLTPQEQARMVEVRPINAEAHEAYLRGRFYWNKRSADGIKKAIEYFEQAILLDPAWPLGYAGLADAYALMPHMRPSEKIPKARAAAAKALEMDESLAEAHASLGNIATDDWDWPTAEREYERAIALSPNYATTHHWYARYFLFMGRHDEAIREAKKAQELDPLSLIVGSVLGAAYYYAGDFEQAESQLRKTLEHGPDFAPAHRYLAETLLLQGRFAEAIPEAREAARLRDNTPSATLGYLYAKAGQPQEARKILDELAARSTEEYVPPTHFAFVHAGLDERDRMFDWLEKAYQDRDILLPATLIDPCLADMRSDPRFADLVRRVGLPPLAPTPSDGSSSRAGHRPAGMRNVGSMTQPTEPEKIMLAVLPFENLSRDPEQEYFSDGLTEEMITQLGRLNPQRLGVIARTSAMHYKNTDRTLSHIRQELGVDFVVEGSVRRAENHVRITAKLINVRDQTQVWADSFDRELKDILALQGDVSLAVARQINVALNPREEARLAAIQAVDPAAHEAYLKGLYHWNKFTEPGWYKAIDFFREALDVDPTYAAAYAGLAQAYAALGIFYLSPEEAYPKGKNAALKAVALDDSLAHAHTELAAILLFYERDWTAVDRELQRALDLDPNGSITHDVHALYLAAMGRLDEALAAAKRAQSLDPLSALLTRNVGFAHFNARDYEQTIVYCRKALDMDPDFDWAHALKGWALIQQGRYDQVLREYADITNVHERNPEMLAPLVSAYAALGRKTDADRLLDELLQRSKGRYVNPAVIALSYLGLGDHDRAFQWLETALQRRSAGWLAYLNVSPVFDSLRSDPRFVDLLRRVGLPQVTHRTAPVVEPERTALPADPP